MNISIFHKNGFKSDRFHWAAANDWVGEVQKCLQENMNPYRPNKNGLTPLHAAIGNQAFRVTNVLLEQYSNELALVKEHMRNRFLWKMECNYWNKRPILIAWTEEECQHVQSVASTCPAAIPLNVQIFVFLRIPSEGVRLVALDVCTKEKWPAVLRFIRQILPNGVLSLDKSDFRTDCMSYLQAACYVGNKHLLETLLSSGAQLSATGDRGKTPLLTACNALRKDIIKLLLTKYIQRYDPTACDDEQRNAFHIVARKNHPEMTDFVLKALIRYRVLNFGETESEAFNRTFRYEYIEYEYLSMWSLLPANMKKKCSEYAVQYRMDLTYTWRYTLHVLDLIANKLALNYCFEEIRTNLDILRIETHRDSTNILHALLQYGHIEFVEELYQQNPSIKTVFNTQGAVQVLTGALRSHNVKLLGFILQHHKDYFQSEAKQLEEGVITYTWFDIAVYREPFSMLSEAFPEMREKISKTVELVEKTHNTITLDKLYTLLEKDFEQAILTQSEEVVVNEAGRNVLHQATDYDNQYLVEKLLESSVDLYRKDNEGNLPICHVSSVETGCKSGHEAKILSKLLALGFDVNQPTKDGNVPLSLASCCTVVAFLLQHGASLELIDGSALQGTLRYKRYCAVWTLIPKIAHFEWFEEMAHAYLPWMLGNQNRDFFTCSCGDQLEKYPDIRRKLYDSLYRHSKEQAADFFLKVCHRSMTWCARWFLDYGYDIDFERCNEYGYTPLLGLLSYMEEPNHDIVERLIVEKGVNVNATNDRKQNALLLIASPFRSAQWYGYTLRTIELLLDHGAELNAQDENGNSALHCAFEENQMELVELLIERGADVKLRNAENELPYQKCDKRNVMLYKFLG
ncbi:AGAP004935-PA-like protein [Anopheles sinensis]|uniref:AGAP004935-PA-like protein n=1 Tax=Anopheles sinensis TaxID=74873 RepID=A0A084WCY5_ANOSI|nr:AGAP004935-PA-like protein [Anopheles sinensis]